MDREKLLEIDGGFVEGFWVEHMKPEWMNSHVLDKCVDKPDSAFSSQKKNQDMCCVCCMICIAPFSLILA